MTSNYLDCNIWKYLRNKLIIHVFFFHELFFNEWPSLVASTKSLACERHCRGERGEGETRGGGEAGEEKGEWEGGGGGGVNSGVMSSLRWRSQCDGDSRAQRVTDLIRDQPAYYPNNSSTYPQPPDGGHFEIPSRQRGDISMTTICEKQSCTTTCKHLILMPLPLIPPQCASNHFQPIAF